MVRFIIVFFLSFPLIVNAQKSVKLEGNIIDEKKNPLENVIITINNTIFSQTNKSGNFIIRLQQKQYFVNLTLQGYKSQNLVIDLSDGKDYTFSTTLKSEVNQLQQVDVTDNTDRNNAVIINTKSSGALPNPSFGFEAYLKQLPGVSTNNELSSQYTVRGGNFDENLIYINDIEIYKPFLIRNGQQEGLSFINPDLTKQVKFSAGGFDAIYGDKLSSVLDVKYGFSEDSLRSNIVLGTNGASLSYFSSQQKRNNFIASVRYKNNQFVLNSQPVKGNYTPYFFDLQLLTNHQLNKKLSLSSLLIGNYSNFKLLPRSSETKFGTFNETLRLQVAYEGQEDDRYTQLLGGITLNYAINNRATLKWISSYNKNNESENFDITGSYIFSTFDDPLLNGDNGNTVSSRGIGVFQNFGRNKLTSEIITSELKLNYISGKSFWQSGLKFQTDAISDQLSEFERIDSAGFTLPESNNGLELSNVINTNQTLRVYKFLGYVQNNFDINKQLNLSVGLRFNYNSFTSEFLVSPRVNINYKITNSPNLILHLAVGRYVQPPFFRELRDFNGIINYNQKSQKSLHFLAGTDYTFKGLGTTLKFTSEVYYKKLDNLIPYKIDNLRIRYFANQIAKGYATGADFRLSGTFVKDLESSFRLSFLQTKEDIENDFILRRNAQGITETIYPGYLFRPTDQRINFSIFFQDRLLKNPSYKTHLNLLYGTRLPVGPPNTPRALDIFKIPAYKRFDIGFSKDFLDAGNKKRVYLKRYFKSITLYAEVFNVLNNNNTVSYLWIKDVDNNQYAIPNFLTSRQFNIRLLLKL